ncbi:MAG: DUF362 domain-containing protein [Thermodesulfobacteriota bacterium]
MDTRIFIKKTAGIKEIKERVSEVFDTFKEALPTSKKASILLKPNLNANMNALTGNTTDLRILAGAIEALKKRGYTNVKIGEGTNSGYYRSNISVISRLKVDALARFYSIETVDLNYSEPHEIEFEDGVRASVARDAAEADFLINLPKLKTHFEAGMSVCLKNLMGTLVGQENKKKTHKSLARNILRINDNIRPGLHIVDGLIAMEGLGPTRGIPVKTGFLLAGTDPYLLDVVSARLAGFDYQKVRTLSAAEELGKLTPRHIEAASSLDIKGFEMKFAPPVAGPLATFIHHPSRQKYFLAVRNTKLFNYICSTKTAGKVLYATGLRQDVFIDDEMEFKGLILDREKCKGHKKCAEYCPVEIKLPDDLERPGNGCIECLYCYMVCPEEAIVFKGKLGFVDEQIRQYDKVVRETA